MKRKFLSLILFIIVILTVLSLNVYAENNLVKNSSFEEGSEKIPSDWNTEVYNKENSALITENGEGHTGSRFVTIKNNAPNDARYIQKILVKENTIYKLSCWVKTDKVGEGQSSIGAILSFQGRMERSDEIEGTNDKWKLVEWYVNVGSGVENLVLTVGLGGYGADNTGEASFDDISAEEISSAPAGKQVTQVVDKKDDSSSNSSASGTKEISGKPRTGIFLFLAIGVIVVFIAFVYYRKIKMDESENDDEDSTDETTDQKTTDEESSDEITLMDIQSDKSTLKNKHDNEDLI